MSDDWGNDPLVADASAKGIEINNPLNLRPLAKGKWPGQTGVSNGFAVFDTLDDGWKAADQNLQAKVRKHSLNSLDGIIGDPDAGWAPAADNNDPASYAAKVAKASGVGARDNIGAKLLSDAKFRRKVLAGMANVETGIDDTSQWGNDPINAADGPSDAGGGQPATKEGIDAALKKPTPLQRAKEAVSAPWHQLGSDLSAAYGPQTAQERQNGGAGQLRDTPRLRAADSLGGDLSAVLRSPLAAGLAALGDTQADSDAAAFGTAAGYIFGGKGRPEEPRPRVNALKSAVEGVRADDPHTADVRALHDAGVRMTPGQIKGGLHKELEEKQMSHPVFGASKAQGVRDSIHDYNRAEYRRTLGEAGMTYPANGPVGMDGVNTVYTKLSAGYDALKPEMKAAKDAEFDAEVAKALPTAGKEGSREYDTVQHIIEERVLPAFGKEGMDGETFKELESFLTSEAKRYKNSTSAYEQNIGSALDEVNDAIRGSLERHSAESVRPQLKKLNRAYASYKKIESAAYKAKANDGVFTPNQIEMAMGEGGRRQRSQVARGVAPGQDFVRAAKRVLPNRVPDSGTAGRSMLNKGVGAGLGMTAGAAVGHTVAGPLGGELGGALGATLGTNLDVSIAPTTNALARHMLDRAAAKELARRGIHTQPHNYLRAVTQRAPAIGPPP